MTRAHPPTRSDLVKLLSEAAAVEHALCGAYLFSALSLKASVDEGLTDHELNHVTQWERLLLMVARQEMEHLGLVCNLLTAVGGAPTFAHPPFPYPTSLFRHEMTCTRLDRETLMRFVCFERPARIEPEDAFCAEGGPSRQLAPGPGGYRTVGELYARIRETLLALDAAGVDLFLGQARNEITGAELGLDFPRYRAKGGVYDVFLFAISDLPSALRAIDLIIEQGEGGSGAGPRARDFLAAAAARDGGLPEDPPMNPPHYRVFLQLLAELDALTRANPSFEPSRRVVPNPRAAPRPGATVVTNPLSRAVLELFTDAYATMLLMLTRLFNHTDESVAELAELKSAAFFPFMTMLIRPLSEILTQLPAGDEARPERAGPCFDAPTDLAFLPHRRAAFLLIGEQLVGLRDRARAVSKLPGAPARVAYVAETIDLIERRWAAVMASGKKAVAR
ncbi:MAG: ferritin-like protein [Polyangiaceae bacterium]|nr:ferritin-like protein [Polyangiaceae bacterium]